MQGACQWMYILCPFKYNYDTLSLTKIGYFQYKNYQFKTNVLLWKDLYLVFQCRTLTLKFRAICRVIYDLMSMVSGLDLDIK